jgi:hypothetical protein
MKHLPALVVAALCAALSMPVCAQEDVLRPHLPPRFTLGFEAGASYNMLTMDIARTVGFTDSPYDAYESGTGVSPYAFASIDYALSKNAGIMLKLGLDRKSFGNERTGLADCVIPRPGGSLIYDTTRERLQYTVSSNFFAAGLEGRYDLTPELFATLGPVMHVRVGGTSQTEIKDLPEDGGCYFNDGTRHSETTTDIQTEPTVRLGVEIGAGYRIPVARRVAIVPQLRFQYMITDFLADRDSGDEYQRFYRNGGEPDRTRLTNTVMHSVQLGIGVQFGM